MRGICAITIEVFAFLRSTTNLGYDADSQQHHPAKAAALTTSDPPRPIFYASARSLIRRIHHRQIREQRRCMAGSPGPRIAWPLATERTRSSLRATEPATLHCSKPTPISSTLPQTPSVPFAKRSRRRSNTGYRGAPGSMQLGRIYLEILLHFWR